MELDDLKTAWEKLDYRVEGLESVALHDFKARRLDRVRSAVRWIGIGQTVQLLIWGVVVAIVGPFWIEHRDTLHLLLAGLSLHVYGVVTICASVVQLCVLALIDYSKPVLTIQKRLVQLRRLRILSNLYLSLPWWPLWLVATLVGSQWWLGIDLYAQAPGWIQMTLIVCTIGMLLTAWRAQQLIKRPPANGFFKNLLDDMAGRHLVKAIDQLDEITRFERE